jgi:hypothetical protein
MTIMTIKNQLFTGLILLTFTGCNNAAEKTSTRGLEENAGKDSITASKPVTPETFIRAETDRMFTTSAGWQAASINFTKSEV